MDDASELELEVLYRALAKRCHPDAATTDDERRRRGSLMQRLNRAYAQKSVIELRSIARELEGKATSSPSSSGPLPPSQEVQRMLNAGQWQAALQAAHAILDSMKVRAGDDAVDKSARMSSDSYRKGFLVSPGPAEQLVRTTTLRAVPELMAAEKWEIAKRWAFACVDAFRGRRAQKREPMYELWTFNSGTRKWTYWEFRMKEEMPNYSDLEMRRLLVTSIREKAKQMIRSGDQYPDGFPSVLDEITALANLSAVEDALSVAVDKLIDTSEREIYCSESDFRLVGSCIGTTYVDTLKEMVRERGGQVGEPKRKWFGR